MRAQNHDKVGTKQKSSRDHQWKWQQTPSHLSPTDSWRSYSRSERLLRLLSRLSSGQNSARRSQAPAAAAAAFKRRRGSDNRSHSFPIPSNSASSLLGNAPSSLLGYASFLPFAATAAQILRRRPALQLFSRRIGTRQFGGCSGRGGRQLGHGPARHRPSSSQCR